MGTRLRSRPVHSIRTVAWGGEQLGELQRACYRVARGLVRPGGTVDLDDLVQEGCIAGWKHLQDGKPMSYAVTAARGTMIDHLRTHGPMMRGGKQRATAMDPTTMRDVDFTPAPCAFKPIDDTSERIWLLEQLKGREREVIERNVLGEEHLHEIAADWGVTESRACQIKAKALKRMRAALEDALTGAFDGVLPAKTGSALAA